MSTQDGLPPNPTAALLMTLVQRNGTAVLCKVLAALVLFVLLHLVRIPLVLLVRVLAGVMSRVDTFTTRQIADAPRGPINHYFDPATVASWEPVHA